MKKHPLRYIHYFFMLVLFLVPLSVQAITWEGDESDVWSLPGNWIGDVTPISTSDVIIPDETTTTYDPVLDSAVTIDTLTIDSGGILSTGGQDITVSTTLTNNGTFILTGDETVSFPTTTITGLVQYVDGSGDGSLVFTTYYDLEIGGSTYSHGLSGDTTVNGDLTITSGELTSTTHNLSVTGDSVIDSDITCTGAADLSFNGGVSTLSGNTTTVNGSINISGGSAALVITGELNAGTGTITIDGNGKDILCEGDSDTDLWANTISLTNSDTLIGNSLAAPLITGSTGTCDLTLDTGDVAIYIDHTGDLSPYFGADRDVLLALSLTASGTLTIPTGYTIGTNTTNLILEGDTVVLTAGGTLTSTTGAITISSTDTAATDFSINQAITTTTGEITINCASGSGATLSIDQTITSTSGDVIIDLSDAASLSIDNTISTGGDLDLTITSTGNDDVADVTQSVSLATSGLVLRGTGDYNLNLPANRIDTLAGDFTGDLYYAESDTLEVGHVSDIYGLNTNGGSLWLQNNSNAYTTAYTQASDSPLDCDGFVLKGYRASVNFNNTSNQINTLSVYSGSAAEPIRVVISTSSSLTIGTVSVLGTDTTGLTNCDTLTLDLDTNDLMITSTLASIDLSGAFTLVAGGMTDEIGTGDTDIPFYTAADVTLTLSNATTLDNTWTFDGTSTFTGSNITFYDVEIAASSTLTAGSDIIVAHNWTNSAADTAFSPATYDVSFIDSSVTSTITGDTTFYDFTCTTDLKTIAFTDSSTQTISGALTIGGTDKSNLVYLTGTSTAGWTFDNTGNSESVSFAAISYGYVDSNSITASESVNVDGTTETGTDPCWTFTVKDVIWDGSDSTDWATGANWDWNYVPNDEDNVTIENVTDFPSLDESVIVNDLTIDLSAELTVTSTYSVTINGTLYNNGTIYRTAACSISETDADSGTIVYQTTGGTIEDYGVGDDYNILEIDGVVVTEGANLQTFSNLVFSNSGTLSTTSNNLTVGGDISGTGTLSTTNTEAIDVSGSLSVSTITVGAGTAPTFTVAGSLTLTNLTAENSSFTMDGGAAQILTSNSEPFYNLTISNTSGGVTTADDVVLTGELILSSGLFDTSGDNVTTDTITLSGGSITNTTILTVDDGDLTIDNSGSTFDGATVTISDAAGDLLVSDGTFSASGAVSVGGVSTLSGGTSTTDGTFSSTGLITVSGGTLNTNSTVTASSGLTISSGTMTAGDGLADTVSVTGDLTLSGTGNLSGSGALDVSQDILLSGTGTFTGGSRTIELERNWTETAGVFTANASTVEFDGTTSTLTTTNSLNNLLVSSGTVTLGSAVDCSGYLSISSGAFLDVEATNDYSLTVGGNWANGGTFYCQEGTVTLDGSGDISGMDGSGGTDNFYNLTLSGSGAWTTSSDLVISQLTTISGGSLDSTDDDVTTNTLTLSGGDLTNTTNLTVSMGDFTISSATSAYTGAGVVTISLGDFAFSDGSFTPSGNVTLSAGDLLVSGGTFTTSGSLSVAGVSTLSGGTSTTDGTFSSTGLITVSGGDLNTNSTVTASSGLTISSGTMTAGDAIADTVSVTGDLTLSGMGNLAGSGALDVSQDILLSGTGTFTGGSRTINLERNWSELAGVFSASSSTVEFDGTTSTLTTTNSLNNLLVSSGTVTLGSAVDCSGNLTLSGAGVLTTATLNMDITGNLDLSGTSSFTITDTATLSVDGTTDIASGTTLSVDDGAVNLGDATTDTITNAGTFISTATGTGNIILSGDYVGTSGSLTGSSGGDPTWSLYGDASFGTVTMNGDPILFEDNLTTSHTLTLSGATTFSTVTVGTDNDVTLAGAGTFTATTLQTGDSGTDGDTAIFDAADVDFSIGTLNNGGSFQLEGSQTHTVSTYDIDSGWTVYYGGTENLSNSDMATFWNLEIESGTYTLGQNIFVVGTGSANYDDEGLFINGGTLNGSTYDITITEAFSTSGGGTFNCDTSEVIFTGSGDSLIDGDITFYQLTSSYLAYDYSPPSVIADSTISGKTIYFTANTTTSVTGYLTLSGDPSSVPIDDLTVAPSSSTYESSSSYLHLRPSPDPADEDNPTATEYWFLDVQTSAEIYMENVLAWFSDASSNPFVLQTEVYTWECEGWLSYVEILYSYTEDSDDNGKIDRIRIEVGVGLLQDADSAYSDFTATVSGYTVSGYSDGTDTYEFYIELEESSSLDTGVTPTLQITENNSLVDSASQSKLVIVPPFSSDNSSTQTIIDTAAPVIGYTLAVAGNDNMYIHFSEPVQDSGAADPDNGDFTFTGLATSSAGLTAITSGGSGGIEEALITFSSVLTASDVLSATIDGSGLQDLATTPNAMDTSLDRNNNHYITDILIGPNDDSAVEPLWATDDTVATSTGSGTGVINEFDGTEHLKDEDITLQAHVNSDIDVSVSGVELRYVQDPSSTYTNDNGLWIDDYDSRTEDLVSGLAPYLLDNANVESVAGTVDSTTQVYNFSFDSSELSNNEDLYFLFYLDDYDRYTGRLEDQTASEWYNLVYPWSFGVHNIVDQGNNVSILNNVINPQEGDEATLYYELSNSGMVSVQVFDLAGGLVEILHRGSQDSGEYSLVWNGTNRSNNTVARGIYFIRIVGPDLDEMRKVLVIK